LPQVLAVQHRQPDSKTILAWQKVLEERERIFSPHYGLIGGKSLEVERRQALSKIYLEQAYALVGTRRIDALKLLARSFSEWPRAFWDFAWPGVLRRAVFL
jgi:hypothetical protein